MNYISHWALVSPLRSPACWLAASQKASSSCCGDLARFFTLAIFQIIPFGSLPLMPRRLGKLSSLQGEIVLL
jgi:hypothetical protein